VVGNTIRSDGVAGGIDCGGGVVRHTWREGSQKGSKWGRLLGMSLSTSVKCRGDIGEESGVRMEKLSYLPCGAQLMGEIFSNPHVGGKEVRPIGIRFLPFDLGDQGHLLSLVFGGNMGYQGSERGGVLAKQPKSDFR